MIKTIRASRFTSKTIRKATTKKHWYDFTVRSRGPRGKIVKVTHNHDWVDYPCNY